MATFYYGTTTLMAWWKHSCHAARIWTRLQDRASEPGAVTSRPVKSTGGGDVSPPSAGQGQGVGMEMGNTTGHRTTAPFG